MNALLLTLALLQPSTLDANGWTVLTPSADSRIIYVSSSAGLDTNDGLSQATPRQTIDSARRLLRDGFPDWLLLKSGDTFVAGNFGLWTSGRSIAEPQVLGSYGTGPRPILQESSLQYNGGGKPETAPWQFMVIRDLDFRGNHVGNPANVSNNYAMLILEETQHMLIEGNSFSGYRGAINIQQSPTRNGPNGNLTFRRNTVCNNVTSGVFIQKSDGVLIEENVIDRNGHGIDGNTPSTLAHNVYVFEIQNLTVRGNIFSRASNFGTKLSSDRPGGFTNFTLENNLYFDNGLSLDHSAGSTGDVNTTFTHDGGTIHNNVFTDLIRRGGVQQDLAAYPLNTRDVVWSQNMFVHKAFLRGNPLLYWGQHHQNITVRDSVIYQWDIHAATPAAYLETDAFRIDGYTLTGNQIDMPAATYVDPTRTVGSYNTTIGGMNDPLAFIAAASSQSKINWNPALTAAAVNTYIRSGFAVAGDPPPPVDPPIDPPPVDPPVSDLSRLESALVAAAKAFLAIMDPAP